MPRLPYPDVDRLPGAVRERLAERLPLNVYRMLAHAPTLFPGWMDLGRAVLYESQLDPQLRELAILRVGRLAGSAYEVHQHRKIALAVGLTADQVEATRVGAAAPVFDARQSMVLEFTDRAVNDVRVDDATFTRCVEALGERRTIELLVTIGFYMMVVRLLENTGVEIEAGGGPSLDEVARSRQSMLARYAPREPDAPGGD